ncbi:MAG: HPr family phosphocarrier protein [Candidatus Omnitrophica bacterium]|nr:HPr family phosphocarrier protein [Candidatus Omnitrophota bacterium]MDE2009099.1 HPr family phosphocarrier protein [Candidatus Omnitrophota bacterium]MDE2214236.1 HPr family phosphocarrier protein [Candidatus Omnitrophota bacterium]MDE2231273.1 HPr family phosphocarrier protein [Candidatus Omnitrophota bacterium]
MIIMHKLEKELTVLNKKGLHARPAALFVGLAEKYGVTVTVAKGSETVNGASIMGLLMLGAVEGTVLKITVEGDRAQEAMAGFEDFFNKQDEELPS